MLGKHHTDKTKEKIRLAKIDSEFSKETKEKMKLSQRKRRLEEKGNGYGTSNLA
jgi:hypothetical protein